MCGLELLFSLQHLKSLLVAQDEDAVQLMQVQECLGQRDFGRMLRWNGSRLVLILVLVQNGFVIPWKSK